MLTNVTIHAKKITTLALLAAVIAFGGRTVFAADQAAGADTGGYAAVYRDEGGIDHRDLGPGGAEARATNPVPAPSEVDHARSIYTTPTDPASGGYASVYGDEGSLNGTLEGPAPVVNNYPNMSLASASAPVDTMKNIDTTPHDAANGGYANIYQDEDGTEG